MINIDWKFIKKRINQELKGIAKLHPNIFSIENINRLEKVIVFELNSPEHKLDGVEARMPNAFQKILIEGLTKEDTLSFFPDFAKLEPFLKKLLFIVNEPIFSQLTAQRKGLAVFIDELDINPGNLRLSTENIEDHIGGLDFQDHLLRSYQLRNTESHLCENWSSRELYQNVESILIIYIYAVSLHAEKIDEKINRNPSVQSYLIDVVKSFEKWQNRFVHIMGKEKFEEIDLYALESDQWVNDEETKPMREGKIDDLRKSIQENQMVILGEPGMGKSTTLQYLAYRDAKRILDEKNTSLKIPVFIELKLFSKGDKILDVLTSKLGLTINETRTLLNEGKLSIFLDGLNEVIKDIRKEIRVLIQNFISNFPDNQTLITTRPLAYSNEFKEAPVFVLQKLDTLQVDEFLNKNCSNLTIRELIKKEIDSNPRFAKIVKVPLMLRMLINVAISNGGEIPINKVIIIKDFINGLYAREQKKISDDSDFRVIHRLLCFLGYKSRKSKGSNAGMRFEEIEAVIEKRIEKSRFKLSVYNFIDSSVDLNIIVKDGNKYSFIHELYQEYYASEEFLRMNAKQSTI